MTENNNEAPADNECTSKSAQESANKTCWACQANLKANQKYCHNCNQWQNFWRHIPLSIPILSLVIAAISVSIPLLDKLAGLYDPVQMNVSISFPDFDAIPKEAKLQIINQGKSPAIFFGKGRCEIFVRYLYKGELRDNWMIFQPVFDDLENFVEIDRFTSLKLQVRTFQPITVTSGPSSEIEQRLIAALSASAEDPLITRSEYIDFDNVFGSCDFDIIYKGETQKFKTEMDRYKFADFALASRYGVDQVHAWHVRSMRDKKKYNLMPIKDNSLSGKRKIFE